MGGVLEIVEDRNQRIEDPQNTTQMFHVALL